jgi:hypothetical protein
MWSFSQWYFYGRNVWRLSKFKAMEFLKMKLNLQKLHAQIIKWRPHGIIAFWWAFFMLTIKIKIDCNNSQIMHFILCYNILLMHLVSKLKQEKA